MSTDIRFGNTDYRIPSGYDKFVLPVLNQSIWDLNKLDAEVIITVVNNAFDFWNNVPDDKPVSRLGVSDMNEVLDMMSFWGNLNMDATTQPDESIKIY